MTNRDKHQPNIMLVVLDATRADACGCYGSPLNTTPVLDRLAEEGTLYEQAISAAPWTLPAVASILTGLYPGQTGIYNTRVLETIYPTLAELLAGCGYGTFGITNNSWLSAGFGLQRGFGTMHKQWQWLQTSEDINKLVLMEDSGDRGWAQTVLGNLRHGNLVKNSLNAAYTRLFAYRRDLGAARMLKPVARWIEQQERPWLAFVHYLEAHLPYRPPVEWAARYVQDMDRGRALMQADQWRLAWRHMTGVELMAKADLAVWRQLYLASVAYTDYQLGRLVDWLAASGRLDDTLLIVLADHGESLGEGNLLNHQYTLADHLIRVPMVIRFPALFPAGRRVSPAVQTLDLFQTILDAAGGPEMPSASRSLLGEADRPFTVAEYGVPRKPHARALNRYGLKAEQVEPFARGLTALRTERHKLVLATDGSAALYDLEADALESSDVASQRPELVESMRAQLADWREGHGVAEQEQLSPADMAVDPEVEARLQALGYLD
jgi:arylsulfatase A-like enzyme